MRHDLLRSAAIVRVGNAGVEILNEIQVDANVVFEFLERSEFPVPVRVACVPPLLEVLYPLVVVVAVRPNCSFEEEANRFERKAIWLPQCTAATTRCSDVLAVVVVVDGEKPLHGSFDEGVLLPFPVVDLNPTLLQAMD